MLTVRVKFPPVVSLPVNTSSTLPSVRTCSHTMSIGVSPVTTHTRSTVVSTTTGAGWRVVTLGGTVGTAIIVIEWTGWTIEQYAVYNGFKRI